jgi:glycosyltransferase involved in cell wall biosynthesis
LTPQTGSETPRLVWTQGSDGPAAAHVRTRPRLLSCVIPAYNESTNLALLLPALRSMLETCADTWEIIVVDDGSSDDTAALLAREAEAPGTRGLLLSRNFGKEAATMAGLQAARGDVVLCMDADLQHPPETIPSLLRAWRGGANVVYALRNYRADETRIKRWGTRVFYALINAADRFEMPPGAGDFRLMDRAVVDALLALPERNRFMKGLYAWVGFDTVAVPYDVAPRAVGKTRFGLRQLTRLSLAGITAFTTWPLRAVSMAGVLLAFIAFGYGMTVVFDYLVNGNTVSGWTTIVVSLMFLSGVQMVSLGVVGEYVGRVFEEVKGRPLYIVKRELGQSPADESAARS